MSIRFPFYSFLILISISSHVFAEAEEKSQLDQRVEELMSTRNVNPKITAILVIDMQNEFLSSEGDYARQSRESGGGKPEDHKVLPRYQDEVDHLVHLLDAARKRNITVVYTKFITHDESGVLLVSAPFLWRFRNTPWVPETHEGSWDAEIITDVLPRDEEVVIRHSNENCFLNTSLTYMLKSRGSLKEVQGDTPVGTVLITGLNLGGGLDPAIQTGFGGSKGGFSFIPVIDCLVREHRLSQNFWVDHNWTPYTSKEIMAVWKRMDAKL